jgi:hypothetical protein
MAGAAIAGDAAAAMIASEPAHMLKVLCMETTLIFRALRLRSGHFTSTLNQARPVPWLAAPTCRERRRSRSGTACHAIPAASCLSFGRLSMTPQIMLSWFSNPRSRAGRR